MFSVAFTFIFAAEEALICDFCVSRSCAFTVAALETSKVVSFIPTFQKTHNNVESSGERNGPNTDEVGKFGLASQAVHEHVRHHECREHRNRADRQTWLGVLNSFLFLKFS